MEDFTITNHGSIYLVQPHTRTAREWVESNLPAERQMFGSAVAVEHRFIADIAEGITNDGLEIA